MSVWSIPDCKEELRFAGHSSVPVGCARFRPGAYENLDPLVVNAASSDHHGRVVLWSLGSDQPVAELEQHGARVSRIAFHQSGDYIATCW